MKNILGIELEKNPERKIDGECFVERTISAELDGKLNSRSDELYAMNNKYSLPSYLSVIKSISLVFVIIMLFSILTRDKQGMIFSEYIKSIKTIIIVFVIALVIYISIFTYEIVLSKKRKNNINEEEIGKEINNLELECLQYLEVPDENINIDFFAYYYKTKDTKKGLKKVDLSPFAKFMTFEFHVYKKDNKLCLADCTQVITIDIDTIDKIYINKEKTTSFNWTKEKEPKEYGVSRNSQGVYIHKEYCSIIITNDDTKYELCFPLYELDNIKNLTGKSSEEI